MPTTQLFILVKCDVGFAEQVGTAIIDEVKEVSEVHSITGNYDLLVKADLRGLESMASIVQGKLHKIEHIRETNTFLSFKILSQDIGDFGD
jgi:DNA-binding Lrp family transcriptional regulator